MSPQLQLRIEAIVREIYRSTYAPVATTAVASRYGLANSQMRYYLARLAEQGIIERVGSRRGWLPKGV